MYYNKKIQIKSRDIIRFFILSISILLISNQCYSFSLSRLFLRKQNQEIREPKTNAYNTYVFTSNDASTNPCSLTSNISDCQTYFRIRNYSCIGKKNTSIYWGSKVIYIGDVELTSYSFEGYTYYRSDYLTTSISGGYTCSSRYTGTIYSVYRVKN